jgi:branched-chain amino acid transport system permease protein
VAISPDREDTATPAESRADGDAADGDDESPPEDANPDPDGLALDDDPWYRRYLRESSTHLLVILLFAAYPGVYAVLTHPSTPANIEMLTVLPRVETMIVVLYFGLFAMSFDFISGYTGYLSFGHAAFFGVGAYFVVLTANGKIPLLASGTPFMLSLLIAGVLAAVLALLIGSVSFRLSGVYFAMITLGVAQVLYVLFSNWGYVGDNPRDGIAVGGSHLEGFAVGIPWIDALNLKIGAFQGDTVEGLLGVLTFSTVEVSYYMLGVVVVLSYFVMQRIVHSPFGRVMIAIRENEERARAIGYDVFRYKMGAFAISGFFGAVAGALFAGYSRSVSPDGSFYFLVSGDALLAAIIGGFGTLAGALFGHLFHEVLREFLSKEGSGGGLLPYLRDVLSDSLLSTELYNGFTVGEFVETFLNGHAALYIGVVFVLFVLYVPNGIVGTLRAYVGGTLAKQVPERFLRRGDRE